MVHFKLLALPFLLAASLVSANVESIADCPKLVPRKVPAKDVTDLRADDIDVVAALGDRYVKLWWL
jgi:phospholipase B1